MCTTELGRVAQLVEEFEKRGVTLIALSCDDVESHKGWVKDIKDYVTYEKDDFPYPIISDEKRELAVKLGMIDPDEKDAKGLPLTARAVSSLVSISLSKTVEPLYNRLESHNSHDYTWPILRGEMGDLPRKGCFV